MAGFALVIGVSTRVRYSASSYAAATGPDGPTANAPVAPRADRVAVDAVDPDGAIDDSDSSELISLQR